MKTIIDFYKKSINYRWYFLLAIQFIFRIPFFINSEKRMHGDEAFLWLLNYNNFNGYLFSLHPYGHDYLGIIDSLFMIPFIAFVGINGLAQQLAMWLVYSLFSYFSVKLTELFYDDEISFSIFTLHLIPLPFFILMSGAYLGGHFTAAVLLLGSVYFATKYSKLEVGGETYIFLSFLFCGASVYTSRLMLLGLIGMFSYLVYACFINKKSKSIFINLLLSTIGFGIGLLPQVLGKLFHVIEPKHNSGMQQISFAFFKNNLEVLLKWGVGSFSGFFNDPYLKYYGFNLPDESMPVILAFAYISFVFILIPILYRIYTLVITRELNLFNIFSVIFILLLGMDFFSILAINRKLDPFSVRYLLPVNIFMPLFFIGAVEFYRSRIPKLSKVYVYILILFLVIGYGRGYTNKRFYNFEGCPDLPQTVQFLNERKIKYVFGNHWIVYNLLKETKFNIIASTTKENWDVFLYPKYYDEIREKSKTERIAFVEPIFISMVTDKFETNGKIFLQDGTYKIVSKDTFKNWIIYIVENEFEKK